MHACTHPPTHLDQQLARPQNEPRVGVAHARGKLAKRARIARVRVRAEQDFARLAVSLLHDNDDDVVVVESRPSRPLIALSAKKHERHQV